jgi:soluble lytic murein transglycosylase-like protein
MTWLMERGLGGGDDAYDLFRVIAAYNGGAGAVTKTRKRMEPDADALLFMESLPARETREYVEKVALGYWTYRRMWGQPTSTLDQAARYDRLVDLRSDRQTVIAASSR